MKTRLLLSLLAGTCFFAVASGKGTKLNVTAENPSAFPRLRETIEIPLERIRDYLGSVDPSRLAVIPSGSAEPLLTQVTGDALLFQSDFAPRESKHFALAVLEGQTERPPSLVDGLFALPREDYAWENDRIAFRMYGPAMAASVNNGIDVWTKRVPRLIVAKWYKESEGAPAGKDTYHEDRGEGADFFEVGRSLGAGGSALWRDGRVIQPGVFTAQKTLANGPLRVSFELTYHWTVDEHSFLERKTISLDAGQHLNKVQVRFEGTLPKEPLTIACGLVKRPNTHLTQRQQHGWMGLWGLTNSDSVNGYLGTGVAVGNRSHLTFGEDTVQYLLLTPMPTDKPFTYFAGAGWTRNGDFVSPADWNLTLDRASRAITEPLILRYTVER